MRSNDRKFYVPDDYDLDAWTCGIDEQGKRFIRVKGVRWFTNIDFSDKYRHLERFKKWGEIEYDSYDNFPEAISEIKYFLAL